ncbi:hypothetical protein BN2127_JRS4_04146 [Bacillus cereus]|jgi:hypothetical protein|nr:hypothetical protein BN2127_JRS4_04146 [Bacillus cereus]
MSEVSIAILVKLKSLYRGEDATDAKRYFETIR